MMAKGENANLTGIVAMDVIAARMGVTKRCALRRLQKYDKVLRASGENVGKLLVRFTPGGEHYVDAFIAGKYIEGLVKGEPPKDPVIARLDHHTDLLLEIRRMVT